MFIYLSEKLLTNIFDMSIIMHKTPLAIENKLGRIIIANNILAIYNIVHA